MSELAIAREKAAKALTNLLHTASDEDVVHIHRSHALALGVCEDIEATGATMTETVLSRGKGVPQLRQVLYGIKIKDLRAIVAPVLADFTPEDEKIVDEVLPSFLLEEGDDE